MTIVAKVDHTEFQDLCCVFSIRGRTARTGLCQPSVDTSLLSWALVSFPLHQRTREHCSTCRSATQPTAIFTLSTTHRATRLKHPKPELLGSDRILLPKQLTLNISNISFYNTGPEARKRLVSERQDKGDQPTIAWLPALSYVLGCRAGRGTQEESDGLPWRKDRVRGLTRSKWTDPAEHSINQGQEHREKCPETAAVSRTWVRAGVGWGEGG